MVQNKSLIFKNVPDGLPVAGEHIEVEDRPVDLNTTPSKDGLLVQNLYFSFDPYQRGRMREHHIKSYSPAYVIGEPIRNSTISKVLRSGNRKYVEGDMIINYMEGLCQEYSVFTGKDVGENIWKLSNPYHLDPIHFMGPLGMPGLTAYSSFYEIGQPQAGETIFISAASGAVGSLVGQLAKREGLRVVGSVGDDTKLKYIVEDLGFDGGFNYKNQAPMEALKRLAPDGIDIYFENVGGQHLEAALSSLKLFGRIIVCGMIADYNNPFEQKYGVKNLQVFFEKRLKMQGFIVADFQEKYYNDHQRNVQEWIRDGTLKVQMSKSVGMDQAVNGLLSLFTGKNFGKAVLQITDLN